MRGFWNRFAHKLFGRVCLVVLSLFLLASMLSEVGMTMTSSSFISSATPDGTGSVQGQSQGSAVELDTSKDQRQNSDTFSSGEKRASIGEEANLSVEDFNSPTSQRVAGQDTSVSLSQSFGTEGTNNGTNNGTNVAEGEVTSDREKERKEQTELKAEKDNRKDRVEKDIRGSGSGSPCLKFMHIPKTAGSAISQLGRSYGFHWSLWDKTLDCNNRSQCLAGPCLEPGQCEVNRTCCFFPDTRREKTFSCSLWHTPPGFDSKVSESYASCDTFCVIRNPFDRLLSEYGWHYGRWEFPWWHVGGSEDFLAPPPIDLEKLDNREDVRNSFLCNSSFFEDFVLKSLEARRTLGPWFHDCHQALQTDYLFSQDFNTKYCTLEYKRNL